MKEQWLPIKGYEGYYEVSDMGRVKSLSKKTNNQFHKEDRILKPAISNGYPVVILSKEGKISSKKVSVLVTETFIPMCEGRKFVNHIDSDRANNKVGNLEWCTSSENAIHGFLYGYRTSPMKKLSSQLKISGERQWNHVLNEKQVRVLLWWKKINPKVTCRQAQVFFPIAISAIHLIWQRKNWKHVKV